MKQEKKLILKHEKTTELVAMGLPTEQSRSVAEFVVETENETLELVLKKALFSKLKAKMKLEEMILKEDFLPKDGFEWANMRKALD